MTQITLDCLKPYVGTGDTLEEYEGQRDVHTFPIQDVFGGPLTMLPVSRTKNGKWKTLRMSKRILIPSKTVTGPNGTETL